MKEAILQKLEKVTGPDGKGNHRSMCPLCNEKKASLSVNFERGTYHCFGCGAKGKVEQLAENLGLTVDPDPHTKKRAKTSPPVRYLIRDEAGEVIAVHVRRDGPKGKSYYWEQASGEVGLGGIPTSSLPLYGAERVRDLEDGSIVVVTEGEKAAQILVDNGYVALGTVTGAAGTPRGEALRHLVRLRPILWPDNDEPGRSHMHRIAARLQGLGCQDIRIVQWADAPPAGDAADAVMGGVDIGALLEQAVPAAKVEAVDLGLLLQDIEEFISQYVATGDSQLAALTLWTAHTWTLEAADCSPYLHVTSPEKQSGKTRLLEALSLIVAKPWFTARASAAVLVRKVARDAPTLLLDETDGAFRAEKEYAEALRAILNAGYRRGGVASMCVKSGSDFELADFPVFCPKALAGIGTLPDTVADRSIRIALKRRAPSERVERFRLRDAQMQAAPLRERLERWSAVATLRLEGARPPLPDGLSDRATDVWEPLLSIADLAGDTWPGRARETALALSDAALENGFSLGVRLLHDIREVVGEGVGFTPTAKLLEALVRMEESPWGDLRGRPLTARGLARLLRPYGVKPHVARIGAATPRGYDPSDFQDAWERYCLCTPEISETSETNATKNKPEPNSDGEKVAGVSGVALPGGIHEDAINPTDDAIEV